ncbi:translocation/assembly module TamB domain-containing protein [Pseudoalteromonas luteoviolacea]|uniref:Translocation and assembly module TamB C-terminal domain-containing protein n=1 Tax=Pseudoalteromonas luteoviolacea S4054 TaxID=1129367 RepID=A0A0F6A402_9GAMM|nr:translocation/assembly module TamB domain-containing protein [Pseudoalteromonas luteoviolacea]AOT09490.1 hypothetical protein S4054249_17285 [Pseudoalteromonas luteoviolacea]AOT14402.1 hypothetical protein S40542_17255 [Pseudoalteromonas luteoviolacea]AOT19318.1 hypothetical protein S4054_17260 [Pseudoalteromonas luteoviolacea]KKE80937.1 hypothetical protein N479_24270 [Pseudoalteromonas luteoviolacea S4054]KZN65287.1 hypothetical protein N481_02510 [Pseudoalteromonas luteoviolacea S4047-1]
MNQLHLISRLKRRWVALLVSIAMLFVLLLKTHLGNRVMISFVNNWVPELHIVLESGRLLSGGLVNISYQTQGLSISINDMRLTLKWFDCATLCIGLKSKNIKVLVSDSSSAKEENTASSALEQTNSYLSLPILIGIEALSVETINFDSVSMNVAVNDFEFKAQGKNDKLNVALLSAQAVKVEPIPVSANSEFIVPEYIAPLTLPRTFLPLNIDVNKVQLSKFIYLVPEQQPIELNELSLAMSVEHQLVRVEQFKLTHPDFSSYIDLDVHLGTYHVDGVAGFGMPEGAAVIALKGSMDKLLLHGRVSGSMDAKLDLQVSPTAINWPYQLEAQLSNLAIAEVGKLAQLTIASGGNLNNYHAQVTGALDAPELLEQASTISVDASMAGSLSQLNIKRSRIAVEEAFSELVGQISWKNGIQASALGRLVELPLPNLGLTQSATISGDYDVAFSSTDDNWLMHINELELQGQIADLPLNVSLKGEVNEQYIGTLKQAKVHYGKSLFTVAGVLGEEVDLTMLADINHSANDVLPVSAKLGGQVKVVGSLVKPVIDLDFKLDRIHSADFSLQQGHLLAHLDSKNNYQGHVKLDISDVDLDQVDDAQLRFQLNGNRTDHEAALVFDAPSSSLSANVSGQIDNDIWRGLIKQSAFKLDVLSGKLAEPVSLNVGLARFTIADHCWWLNEGQVCLKASMDEQQGNAELRLDRISLLGAQKWIDNGISVDGELNGHAKVSVRQGDIAAFSSQFWVNGAQVSIIPKEQAAAQRESLPAGALNIDRLEVLANGSDKQLHTQWHIEFERLGQFKGELSFADMQFEKQASGYIQVDGVHLHEFTPYARSFSWPDIDIKGAIDGRVNFLGNLHSPTFSGYLKAREVSALSSYLPIQVSNLNLSADFFDQQVNVMGNFKTPQQGHAQLSGNINWQSDVHIDANLKGSGLLLRPMSGVQIALSPDLNINYNKHLLDISGEALIPFARFTLDTLPEDAILVSDDQIIVDEITAKDEGRFIDYQADIDIKLLDDVRITALGLDAYLTGALDIERQPGNALLMGGEVSLLEGRYTAFGQDLIIEQGQLGFNGAPDKPYLNIRAIRNPDTTANDVIAGVMATGSVASPHLTIFSEPAMDQAQAIEYLLNGEPLGSNDGSNNTLLAQFLLAKGIDKSKGLFTKAGKKLGLRDINLAAKGSGGDTQVELSGYITPSVQVSYRVGVFASLSEIAVRYRIFSKLYIEATSGLYDSIDLLYKFDWGD